MIALLFALQAGQPAMPPAGDSIPQVTLAEALERAVQLEPNYVQALGNMAQAEWARKAAKLAFFVPNVTASLDYTKYNKDFFNIGTLNPASTSATFSLDARYELFSVRKFMELGRTAAQLEDATATQIQRQFAAALLVESAYYAVLANQDLVRTAADRVDRAAAQLKLARARVLSGASVQSDSLTVQLELIRARVSLLRLQSALTVSQLELGRRIGFDGPASASAVDSAPPALPLTLAEAVERAVTQGPEYRAARARERQAQAVLKGRQGEYLPTVTVLASHTRFDVKIFPNIQKVSSIGFNISLPIWNGGVREFNVIQARANLDVARAVRTDLERAAARDVTEAYDGYRTAVAAVNLADEGVVVARENYRVQEARYRAGATGVLDLLEAQTALSDAESGGVQARYSARLALSQLEAILGTRLISNDGGRS